MNRSITHRLLLVAVLVTLIGAGGLTSSVNATIGQSNPGALQSGGMSALISASAKLVAGAQHSNHDGKCPRHTALTSPTIAKSPEKASQLVSIIVRE